MKRILIVILFPIILSGIAIAQEFDHKIPGKRLEELEKIKLIETLNLDEQTTLKFFSRRNAHRERMEDLMDQLSDKSDQIQDLLKNEDDGQKLKKAVKEYLELESKIPQEKAQFINSVTDILNDEQLAKLVLFERRFKEEIRHIIFKERGKKRGERELN